MVYTGRTYSLTNKAGGIYIPIPVIHYATFLGLVVVQCFLINFFALIFLYKDKNKFLIMQIFL